MTETAAATPALRLSTAQGRWVVAATVLGSGMAALDATVVGIALPAIGRDFHAGIAGMFQANAPAMGDYAIIVAAGPVSGGGDGGLDLLLFAGIALALFFAAVAGLFWYRRRPAPVPVARLGPGRGRVPSKRKAPRRPPSGRSGS